MTDKPLPSKQWWYAFRMRGSIISYLHIAAGNHCGVWAVAMTPALFDNKNAAARTAKRWCEPGEDFYLGSFYAEPPSKWDPDGEPIAVPKEEAKAA